MTVRSSIPAVVTTLLSTINTAVAGQVSAAGSPVPVIDGEVGTNVADEFIQLVGVTNGKQDWAALGKVRRYETFDVNGLIRVYTGGEDQAYCRQRCFDLYALIETAMNNDPSLGALLSGGTASPSATDQRWGVTDRGGRAAELDFSIAVNTRLTTS